MIEVVKKVGSVVFGGISVRVYGDLDAPLFYLNDVANAFGYSKGNAWKIAELCEEDEKLLLPAVVAGQRRKVIFVTEYGLYDILEQSRMPMARIWRRVINDQLIDMRHQKGYNIEQQFDEWDHAADDYYIDEETGKLMKSVTVEGGDVIQVEA